MKVGRALAKFLVQLEADGRSPHTIGQYRRHVRLLDRWLETERRPRDLNRLDHEDVALFLASPAARGSARGGSKKATSLNALRTSLRCFFRYAHAAGYSSTNPARLVRRARCGTPPPRALSGAEQKRLVKVLGQVLDRDRTLFGLMLATGIRLGSAIALDVEDVDLGRGELRLLRAKGDREERVFLPAGTRKELRAWIGKRASGPLFPARHERISARHASRRFRGILEGAGIDRVRGTHSLRHSFATRVYRKTGDLLLTKEALGHKSIASTIVYARAEERTLRRAIGAAAPAHCIG